MKKIFFFALVIPGLFVSANAQEKYFVFFNDKPPVLRDKVAGDEQLAKSLLGARAIERRKRIGGGIFKLDADDLPVSEKYIAAVESEGVKVKHRLKWFNAVSVIASPVQIQKIRQLPFCISVRKCASMSSLAPSKVKQPQEDFSMQVLTGQANYGPSLTQAALCDITAVHSLGISGEGVRIGILDTGFDWKRHESLMNKKVIAERDFVFGDTVTANEANDATGQDSHGTYVFSVIGGYRDSSVIGPAYGAEYVLAKTEDVRSETHAEEDNYAAALEWMDSLGVDITTSSLGYNTFDSGLSYSYTDMNGSTAIVTKALEKAYEKGILTFTAAGNEGNKSWHYIIAPGDSKNAVTVGAVGSNDTVGSFSSRGPTADGRIKPDVTAMGINVYGASSGSYNRYSYGTGTSAATPIAAGIGAMLLSAFPGISNSTARGMLVQTAESYLNPDNNHGYGLLSALRAVGLPYRETVSGVSRVHKIIDEQAVQAQSLKMRYSANKINYNECSAVRKAANHFYFDLTADAQYYYFVYLNTAGKIVREPECGNYATGSSGVVYVNRTDCFSSSMAQNYPNPFGSGTTIKVYLPASADIRLEIFNTLGERVCTSASGHRDAGEHYFYWNGRNGDDVPAPGGVYLYRLTAGNEMMVKKMVLLR